MNRGIGFADYTLFIDRVTTNAIKKGLDVVSLGNVSIDDDDVLLLTPTHPEPQNPWILIAGGFHGDEPAGSLGIGKFVELMPRDLLARVNLSFLPAVNPLGLKLGQRNDATGDPNRGYCHHGSGTQTLSEVGAIILNSMPIVRPLAEDGFISLHEDDTLDNKFYFVSNDDADNASVMRDALVSIGSKFFDLQPDGLHHDHYITDGHGSWFCDTSFDDLLTHDGVRSVYVTETPALSDILTRTYAATALIMTFIKVVTRYKSIHL